jgi:hypothetical protein
LEAVAIGGRLRDRKDPARPVAKARLALRGTGLEATTDADGRFVFPRVPPGEATLVVRAPGKSEVVRKIAVPSPTYDLEV